MTVIPAAKAGLGTCSARVSALLAFLASAEGVKTTVSEIFGLEHEDALQLWFDSVKCEVAPEI